MKRKYFAYPYILWMICLILAPVLLIFYYALTKTTEQGMAFTFSNLGQVFDPLYLNVLGFSLYMAVIATLICLVLGYPIAYMLSKMSAKTSAILSLLFMLPMWMNMLLRTYAWMSLLQTKGIVNAFFGWFGLGPYQFLYTKTAVIVGLVYNFLPFMILPIYNTLQKIPQATVEAAQDLGANHAQVFTRLIFPQSLPGVVSGVSMVFVPSITTFAISSLLGGGKTPMYGDLIQNQFLTANNWNFGSALSVVLMILVALSMWLSARVDDGQEGGTLL